MMKSNVKCPVCNIEGEAKSQEDIKQTFIDCPRCGKFILDRSALYYIERYGADGLMSAWIRDRQDNKSKHLLYVTGEELETFMNKLPSFSISTKLVLFLRYLKNKSDHAGAYVEIDPEYDYPLVWAKNKEECVFIIQTLIKRKLVDIIDEDMVDLSYKLAISSDGWDYLDEHASDRNITNQVPDNLQQESTSDKPLIFISYASDEVELADFIKQFLLRISGGQLEAFVAKRDISSGANPLKVMLDEKLKVADAIVPICSRKAKNTPWVWWESATVWAKTGKIYPLFTNISAGEFGSPLTLVVQGRDYFVKDEFIEAVKTIFKILDLSVDSVAFTDDENDKYTVLKSTYSKNIESAHVQLGYDTIEQTQALHKYSLTFDVHNKTDSAFDDLVLELYFPKQYMNKTEWKYDHLHSSIPDNMPGYICLTFEYNNLPENGKKQFSANLLPGKILRVFGKKGITNFIYSMDNDRYHDISKFEVKWNLYINKGAPEKGSVQFESLQFF